MFIPLLLSILIIYPLKNIESTLNFNFECLPMIYKSTRQFDFYFCFELSVSGLAICQPVGASPANEQQNATNALLPIALLIIIHPAYTFIWHEIKKKNLCVAQLFDQQTLRRVVQSAHNCENVERCQNMSAAGLAADFQARNAWSVSSPTVEAKAHVPTYPQIHTHLYIYICVYCMRSPLG